MRVSCGIGAVLSAGNMPMGKTDENYILVGDRRKKGRREGQVEGGKRGEITNLNHRFRKNGLISNKNFNKELR